MFRRNEKKIRSIIIVVVWVFLLLLFPLLSMMMVVRLSPKTKKKPFSAHQYFIHFISWSKHFGISHFFGVSIGKWKQTLFMISNKRFSTKKKEEKKSYYPMILILNKSTINRGKDHVISPRKIEKVIIISILVRKRYQHFFFFGLLLLAINFFFFSFVRFSFLRMSREWKIKIRKKKKGAHGPTWIPDFHSFIHSSIHSV